MAKEKLHHLQELVKVVQQGGGPNIPVNDLEDLTLSFSEDQDDSSAYGESEEEATEEDGEEEAESEEDGEEEEDEEDEEEDGEQSENEEEQSDVSKSTDMNVSCLRYSMYMIFFISILGFWSLLKLQRMTQ